MGIKVEFNPDIALRNISEFKNKNRKKEECIPEDIKTGEVYSFLKEGQRNYYLEGEIPLLETKGNQNLSRPKASIIILEATHFFENGQLYTKGRYKVVELFKDDKIHFDGFSRIDGKFK
jgi:hypothetical protein